MMAYGDNDVYLKSVLSQQIFGKSNTSIITSKKQLMFTMDSLSSLVPFESVHYLKVCN